MLVAFGYGTREAVKMAMRNEFTAIVERGGPWHIAYCAEVPGAKVKGKSREECLANLREAIALILEHRREESLRSLPPDAAQEVVTINEFPIHRDRREAL